MALSMKSPVFVDGRWKNCALSMKRAVSVDGRQKNGAPSMKCGVFVDGTASSDFLPDLVVVALAAVAGNHLADEAGEEQLETENDSDQC